MNMPPEEVKILSFLKSAWNLSKSFPSPSLQDPTFLSHWKPRRCTRPWILVRQLPSSRVSWRKGLAPQKWEGMHCCRIRIRNQTLHPFLPFRILFSHTSNNSIWKSRTRETLNLLTVADSITIAMKSRKKINGKTQIFVFIFLFKFVLSKKNWRVSYVFFLWGLAIIFSICIIFFFFFQ